MIMKSPSNKLYRNGVTAFRPTAKLAVLCWHALLLLAGVTEASYAASAEENTEYFFACSNTSTEGQLATVRTLVEKDPSLVHHTTAEGEHCLHLCAISGNADIVQLLLERGADPNVRSSWKDGMRMHPLSWSTYYGRFENIALLLRHGADVNADFDVGGNASGGTEKGTVLDVVEKILSGSPRAATEASAEEDRFATTRTLLVQHGARGYASLPPEPEL